MKSREAPVAAPSPHTGAGLAVAVHDLTVAYRDKPVLWDVDLEVPPGLLLAVVGPNGAGKSTLLKAILGLVPAAAGQVLIHGEPLARARDRVGYVPAARQRRLGLPHLGARRGDDGHVPPSRLDAPPRRPRAPRTRWPRSSASAWRTSPTGRSASFPAASSSACSWRGRWSRTRT